VHALAVGMSLDVESALGRLQPVVSFRCVMRHFWRFATPSTLLLALVLFWFPWMEIGCNRDISGKNPLAKLGVPESVAKAINPHTRRVTLYRQSAWQMACGGWSREPRWSLILASVGNEGKIAIDAGAKGDETDKELIFLARWVRVQSWKQTEEEFSRNLRPSWILTLYPLLLAAASAVGTLLPMARSRLPVMAALVLAALAIVGMQYLQEFPAIQTFRSLARNDRPNMYTQEQIDERTDHYVRETFFCTRWFILAQALTVCGLALSAAEWWSGSRIVRSEKAGIESNSRKQAPSSGP